MRVGLTGLGVVFLITLGAAFAFGSASDQVQKAPEGKPGEPLAQLGVAPGAEKNEAVPVPVPSPASPPEASGTTVVPPPENSPVAGTLAIAGTASPTSI